MSINNNIILIIMMSYYIPLLTTGKTRTDEIRFGFKRGLPAAQQHQQDNCSLMIFGVLQPPYVSTLGCSWRGLTFSIVLTNFRVHF